MLEFSLQSVEHSNQDIKYSHTNVLGASFKFLTGLVDKYFIMTDVAYNIVSGLLQR